MRALHIGKYFPPFAGGIENYCGDLLPALSAAGSETHALVHQHDPSLAPELGVTRATTWGQFAFTPIAPRFRRDLVKLVDDWKPDLLHFHLPNPSAFWALTIASARRRPWVCHWHADVVASTHDRRLRYLYPIYRPFEQRFLAHCDAIVATSPLYAESSHPLHPHRARVRTIPLGADPERLTAMEPVPAWPKSGKLKLLAIGRLTYYKGFSVLLNAMTQVEDTQLVLVGSGELKSDLQNQIERLSLTDRVSIHSGLSDLQRNYLMQQCDLFCLPSIERTEAFGLVLLEAMHSGTPVIASRIPGSGVAWVVDQGGNGLLVEPGQVAPLAAAIRQLKDPTRRQQLAFNAKTNFDAKFAIARNAQLISQLYSELLSRS